MSNRFDLDHDKLFVGPDLGPNCLQRLPADDKSPCTRSKTKQTSNQKHFNHIYIIRGIAHIYVKIFKKLILVPQNQFTHL